MSRQLQNLYYFITLHTIIYQNQHFFEHTHDAFLDFSNNLDLNENIFGKLLCCNAGAGRLADKILLILENTRKSVNYINGDQTIDFALQLSQYIDNTIVSPDIDTIYIHNSQDNKTAKIYLEKESSIIEISAVDSESSYNEFVVNNENISAIYFADKLAAKVKPLSKSSLIIVIAVIFGLVGLPTLILIGIAIKRRRY